MPELLRVQAADGRWETLGVDRHRGVVPEGIVPTWGPNGPDTLTFTLRRDPSIASPDLEAFTPIEYFPDAGVDPTWTGRTIETPGSSQDDPFITVNARGKQYHLDDDFFTYLYVAEDVAGWTDRRSHLATILGSGQFVAGGQVNTDASLTCMFPAGLAVANGDKVGAFIDIGPGQIITNISLDYVTSANNNVGYVGYMALATNDPWNGETALPQHGQALTTLGANGTINMTPNTRYVTLGLQAVGAMTVNPDAYIRFVAIRIFARPGYVTAGASVLKASDVVSDVVDRFPLLSRDKTQVAATALSLREFAAADDTGRNVIDRVNGYHNWRWKVDEQSRVVFQPQADRALLVVDLAKPGAEFADASVNSGEDLYNHVVVVGRSGANTPLRVERFASDLFPARVIPSAQAFTNPTFDVDAAAWTNVTRVTTPVHGGAGAGQITAAATAVTALAAGQTFTAGVTYRFNVWTRSNGTASEPNTKAQVLLTLAATANPSIPIAQTTVYVTPNGYVQASLTWTPAQDTPSSSLQFSVFIGGYRRFIPTGNFIDDLSVTRSVATVPDKRGFTRSYKLTVDAPTDADAMALLGDAFLAAHANVTLKGTLEVTDDRAVRLLSSGAPVPLGQLGRYTTELILLANLVAPDTGDLGRVGVIVAASKSGDTATLTIDNDRQNFAALIARMGAVGAPA